MFIVVCIHELMSQFLFVCVLLLTQSPENMKMFFIGNIVAFIVAVVAIKSFIEIIKKYGFKPWGYYRIIAGIILLAYFSLNK